MNSMHGCRHRLSAFTLLFLMLILLNHASCAKGADGILVTTGVVNLNASTDDLYIVTDSGRINLNAQQPRLPRMASSDSSNPSRTQQITINVISQYDEHFGVEEGVLQINQFTSISSLEITQFGTLNITQGQSLNVGSDEILFHSGTIAGQLSGAAVLTVLTSSRSEIVEMPFFQNEISLEQGILEMLSGESFGSSAGATRVAAPSNALLLIRGSMEVEDDIFLESATGINYEGGLIVDGLCCSTPTVDFFGDVDLGSDASLIGVPNSGGGTSQNANLNMHGPIKGGSLVTTGSDLNMRILSAGNTFTGDTQVRQGTITLDGQGRLIETSAVVINRGALVLENSSTNVADRIADDVPVFLGGGEMRMRGDNSSETLGSASFFEGDSTIDIESFDRDFQESRTITINSLDRQPGATGRVDVSEFAEIHVTDEPGTVGGILPWMIAVDHVSSSNRVAGFATISPERGLVPLTNYNGNINSAVPTENVLVGGSVTTLLSDTEIHSLTFNTSFANLDLDGKKLKIASGGISLGNGPEVMNGQLTAGNGVTNELIITNGRGSISADIVDNDGSPLDVVVSGTDVRFFGNNSYSGKTYVNGELTLSTESSLPENTEIQVVGGELFIDFFATVPKHLNSVRIASDGVITNWPAPRICTTCYESTGWGIPLLFWSEAVGRTEEQQRAAYSVGVRYPSELCGR